MTTRPPKSTRFVCGPESALTSLVLPAAMMSSFLIARASTYGRAELLVKILPLSKIKSGDGCCATHGHWTKKKARAATRYLGTISSRQPTRAPRREGMGLLRHPKTLRALVLQPCGVLQMSAESLALRDGRFALEGIPRNPDGKIERRDGLDG